MSLLLCTLFRGNQCQDGDSAILKLINILYFKYLHVFEGGTWY